MALLRSSQRFLTQPCEKRKEKRASACRTAELVLRGKLSQCSYSAALATCGRFLSCLMRKEGNREWREGKKENKGEQTRRRGKEEAARSERRAHAAVRPGSAANFSNSCPKELLHKKTQRTAQSHEECMKKKTKKKEEGSDIVGCSASQTCLQHCVWAARRRLKERKKSRHCCGGRGCRGVG